MFRYLQTRYCPNYGQRCCLLDLPSCLIQTGLKWDRDNVPGMAASLSYYALFSLFPLLLVLLSVLGALVGPDTESVSQHSDWPLCAICPPKCMS